MQEFYRLRESQPEMTKAEALRRAQLALLHGTLNPAEESDAGRGLTLGGKEKGKEAGRGESASRAQVSYKHPYFWAPFILIGNWK